MDCVMLFYLLLIYVAALHAKEFAPGLSSLPAYIEPGDPSNAHVIDSPEILPRKDDINNALIRQSSNDRSSAAKYTRDNNNFVYGNPDNLGITYGKTSDRVLYSGFRKANDLLDLLQLLTEKRSKRNPLLIYVNANRLKSNELDSEKNQKVSEENNASETLEDSGDKVKEAIFPCSAELFEETNANTDFRRRRKVKYSREKEDSEEDDSNEDTDEESGDEKNPGNPYTIFKNKYRQNWMWNHFMDGDHMNINPYAPQFNSLGPSGAALFFNRKWWYYNQDDYRPFD